MTQRVARPMKFAAFISIIISVAVLFAACQGAVGPQGPPGKDGADGADGTPGTAGPSGFTSLQTKGPAHLVTINDVDDDDADELKNNPGEAQTIDLTDHFRGGVGPFEYGEPMLVTSSPTSPVTAALVDGGPMVKFSIPEDQADGVTVNQFTFEITDSEQSNVSVTVNARRNDAPTAPATAPTATTGTQAPEKAPDMAPACGETANDECVTTVTFVDDNEAEMLTFDVVSTDTAKVEVVSWKTAAVDADGRALSAEIVLKGVASTWAADATPEDDTNDDPGHIAAEVTITATDQGGETVMTTLSVEVDGAPEVKKTIPGGTISQESPTYVIEDVTGFFSNPEDVETGGENLTFSAKSSDETVAKVGFGTGDAPTDATGTRLVVRRVAPGDATITVTATESDQNDEPEQTVDGTFTITVSD